MTAFRSATSRSTGRRPMTPPRPARIPSGSPSAVPTARRPSRQSADPRRSDGADWSSACCAARAASGKRVMVGFDFVFGYPRGAARAIAGKPSWRRHVGRHRRRPVDRRRATTDPTASRSRPVSTARSSSRTSGATPRITATPISRRPRPTTATSTSPSTALAEATCARPQPVWKLERRRLGRQPGDAGHPSPAARSRRRFPRPASGRSKPRSSSNARRPSRMRRNLPLDVPADRHRPAARPRPGRSDASPASPTSTPPASSASSSAAPSDPARRASAAISSRRKAGSPASATKQLLANRATPHALSARSRRHLRAKLRHHPRRSRPVALPAGTARRRHPHDPRLRHGRYRRRYPRHPASSRRRAIAASLAARPSSATAKPCAAAIIAPQPPAATSSSSPLNDPAVPDLAPHLDTTRSAAAVELWRDRAWPAPSSSSATRPPRCSTCSSCSTPARQNPPPSSPRPSASWAPPSPRPRPRRRGTACPSSRCSAAAVVRPSPPPPSTPSRRTAA